MPVELANKLSKPTEVLSVPVVLLLNAQNPTAVLFEAVFNRRALVPIAVLFEPTVLHANAPQPTPTL